jgi:hypothetical protein
VKKVKAGLSRATPSKVVSPLPKSGPAKKIGVVKIAHLKAKPGPRGTSEIELALKKPVGVSKKFHLLGVLASSHGLHTIGAVVTLIAQVPTFDSLGDDLSPDAQKNPSPTKMVEKCVSPSPSVSDEFLRFTFALLPRTLITVLQVLPSVHPCWIFHLRIWTTT